YKALEKGLKDMKRLEKTLGTYQVQAELYRAAKKIKSPSDFLEYLKEQRNQVSVESVEQLRDKGFLDKETSGVHKHLERLEAWQSRLDKESQHLIQESLQAEFARVQDKVEREMKPLIQKTRYG